MDIDQEPPIKLIPAKWAIIFIPFFVSLGIIIATVILGIDRFEQFRDRSEDIKWCNSCAEKTGAMPQSCQNGEFVSDGVVYDPALDCYCPGALKCVPN